MENFAASETSRIAEALQRGAVGVLPTDTVYGLAARAADSAATARLYELKQRERKPGTLIAASAAQLMALGLDVRAIAAAARWWPNPLSVIIPAHEALRYLHQGVGSLAARVPADPQLRALLARTGPLITSSANSPGKPPAANVAEARAYFDDAVDFYVDGGDIGQRPPSTVATIAPDGSLKIVRQGAFTVTERTS